MLFGNVCKKRRAVYLSFINKHPNHHYVIFIKNGKFKVVISKNTE